MKLADLNDGVVISYYPNRMVCSSKKVIEQLKKYIQLSSYSTEAIMSNLVRNFDSEKSHISIMLR